MGKQMTKRTLKGILYIVIIASAVFLLLRQFPVESYFVGAKPVIYLYPEETTRASVAAERAEPDRLCFQPMMRHAKRMAFTMSEKSDNNAFSATGIGTNSRYSKTI